MNSQDECTHEWNDVEEFTGYLPVYVGGSGIHEGYGHPIDWDVIHQYDIYRVCNVCGKKEFNGTRAERYAPYYSDSQLCYRKIEHSD